MQIKIEKLAYGGKGIGRIDGKVYFVENALPGEAVEIEIIRDKKNFIEARTLNIIEASPHRESPPCQYYKNCGGCQYQHLSYSEEIRWKEIQIRESLQKQLSLSDACFLPIVPNSNPYHYRNHITLHRTEQNAWGFVEENNQKAIPIDSCIIAKDEINSFIKNGELTKIDPKQSRVTLRMGAAGKIISSADSIFFNVPIANTRLRTHSRCFFQNNLEMTVKIADAMQAYYEKLKPEQFWDLYAGVGTFTMLVHPKFSQILCIESHADAIEALQMNLNNAGLAAEIAPEAVEDCIEDILMENRKGPIMAILDPPKTGLDPLVSQALIARGPEYIVYLSCHMGALGRDLKALTEQAYEIESIQAFDMFPRTKHIETLVFLKRKQV